MRHALFVSCRALYILSLTISIVVMLIWLVHAPSGAQSLRTGTSQSKRHYHPRIEPYLLTVQRV
jgi:hypothetical protein